MGATKETTTLDFAQLYEQFGPMVLRRCRFLVKDEETALDCMQDTFVRLFERKDTLQGVCSSLFYTVATSVCLNKIRANKLRSGPQIDELVNLIEDTKHANHEEVVDASLLLDAIFTDTKEGTQVMAVLHYVDGLTLEQTAQEVGMSVSGVRKRLSSLRKKAQEEDL